MSVLIRDMKMPKNCYECPILFESRFCAVTAETANSIGWKTVEKRMPNCPLIDHQKTAAVARDSGK